jgi:Glyoxalase-like domain
MTGVLTLSQVIVGVVDLEDASRRFTEMGFDVLDGGVHPGVGTANRVIPLGDQYLELLGVVSRAEAEEHHYGRSLLAAIADGDRLVRWSLRTDAIEEVAARLDITVEPRQRVRPDGELLTWRAAGLDVALDDATTPFFMQWDRPEQYPGMLRAHHANGARRVSSLSLTTRDPERFRSWTAGADAPLRIDARSEPGLWSVSVATADGETALTF